MPEYDGLTSYRKAGLRRLRDAEELLEMPTRDRDAAGADRRHLCGAAYLAGYALECILKAYPMSREANAQSLGELLEHRRKHGREVTNLLGADGHNLLLLLTESGLENSLFSDRTLRRHWSICLKWKSTWRYDPGIPISNAEEFVNAVRRVWSWVDHRI